MEPMFNQNNKTLTPLEYCDSRIQEIQNDYHISDVFDLVFPHMSLLDPGNHRDSAGGAICRSLLHDLFFVIFDLILGVAGRSRTTVWRGSGVVIWRVQVSRVILFSHCTLLIVPFETFYCEGPAVLCTPVESVQNVWKLVLLCSPCIYSPFSQNATWLNLEHNSWPGRNMSLLLNLACLHYSVLLPLQDGRWLTSRRPPVGLSTMWIQVEGPADEAWAHSPRMPSRRCHRVCRYLSGYICG